MTLLAVYREFGSLDRPVVAHLPEGQTLADLACAMPGLPDDFGQRGVICVNGRPAPRALWHSIRPRPGKVTELTFHAPPMGGGQGDNGKQILAIVAAIAITAISGGIAGGSLASTLGANFAKGTIGAKLLAAGVSLVGSLLVAALSPPPVLNAEQVRPPGNSSADGNVLSANGAIPRVIGERKVYPPLAAEALVTYDGDDEVVEVVYALAGPHRLTDIRVDGAAIDSMAGVEYQTREGWPGDLPLTLVRRQARSDAPNSELRGHTVQDDGVTLDSTTGALSDALPQAMVVTTRSAPDEVQLQLSFPSGLSQAGSDTTKLRVPLRLRMRNIDTGGAWIALPELHFQASSLRQVRAVIRLVWTEETTVAPSAAGAQGWSEARIAAPAQTAAPAGVAWAADSYFDAGSGDDWMDQTNLGSTTVAHVEMDKTTASILLDPATFAPGRYEVEVTRGFAYGAAVWSPSAYTISGTVWNLFGYAGSQIGYGRGDLADSLYLVRAVSIWNESPIASDGLALIAVRARNVALSRLSVVAGGWVLDWDGSGWTDWAVTDNPAPHLRDVYVGALNLDPVPRDLLDEDGLVDWRTACASLGYACNALIEDASVDEAASLIASCGYAKPYRSEIWGVVRDYDRTAEAPVQIFTPRNSRGFQFTKAFARVPDGFRVNFRDASRDYDQRQVIVFRDGVSDDSGYLEQVTYEGPVTEAEVRQRARYDQRQAELRSTFYSLDAPAEAIVCRRGSLVGVAHDMLLTHWGSGRVISIETDGSGDVSALTLDAEVDVQTGPAVLDVTDWLAVTDVLALGKVAGIALRRTTGITVHEASNAAGASARLTFSPSIAPDDLAVGALAAVGPLGTEYLRLVVQAISPRENLEASLTLVDEAAELFA